VAGALTPEECKRVKLLIASAGMSQAAIARELMVPPGYVTKLLNGQDGASLARWRQIARIIGVDLWELFAVKSAVEPREPQHRTPAEIVKEITKLTQQLAELATPPATALTKSEFLAEADEGQQLYGEGDAKTQAASQAEPGGTLAQPRPSTNPRSGSRRR